MTSRRLTLVVPSLALGGAERVVSKMANHWAASGNVVTVITLSADDEDTYPLAPKVLRIVLDMIRESRGPIEALSIIRRACVTCERRLPDRFRKRSLVLPTG